MAPSETKPKLPTPAGRRALLNIDAGRGSYCGISSRSAYGGHSGTMVALRRAVLATLDDQLTEAGHAMAARLKANKSGKD